MGQFARLLPTLEVLAIYQANSTVLDPSHLYSL